MSDASTQVAPPPLSDREIESPEVLGGRRRSLKRMLAFDNIGALYVFVIIIVVFSVWSPDTFATLTTVKSVINQNAIAGIVALSLVVPLSTRVFDLSIGASMGLAALFCTWLLVHQHVPLGVALLLTLLLGLCLGALNATLVVIVGIESFIATLATGALMTSVIAMISNYTNITGPQLATGTFPNLATVSVIGITSAALIMFAVTIGLWIFQEHTVPGRRMFATGYNAEAARLTGVRTRKLQFIGLIVSATVASIAGVLIASQQQVGQPDVGTPYLLNAFAAAFLGATQFKGGRFNAWGTLVAVLLLGTGNAGLILVGAAPWADDMFVGVVLLGALGLGAYERMRGSQRLLSARRRRRSPSGSPAPPAGGA